MHEVPRRPASVFQIRQRHRGQPSQVTDGAVALLVMSEQRAVLGFNRSARDTYAYAGCDPARMGFGRSSPSIARLRSA